MGLGRGGKAVLLLGSVVLICAGIRLAAPLLVPVLLAAFLATVSAPLTLGLQNRGVPRTLAVILALLVDVAALGALGLLLGTAVEAFRERLPTYESRLDAAFAEMSTWLSARGLPVPADALLGPQGPRSLVDVISRVIGSVAELVSKMLLVLILVMLMLFEASGLRLKVLRVVGDPNTYGRLRKATREVNTYLAVRTATSLLTGVVIGGWGLVWGLDLWLLWGLLAFLLNYIPTLGAMIAAVPAILVAWMQLGPQGAIGIASGYAVINFLIGNFLEPRVIGRAVGLSAFVVFVSMVVWGWLLGPVGAVLSVPLTMIIKVILSSSEDLQWIAVLLGPASAVESAGPAPTQT